LFCLFWRWGSHKWFAMTGLRPRSSRSDSQVARSTGRSLVPGSRWNWPFFFFWSDWGLNSGLHTYTAGALQFEPHLQ
jgi:hypothetical protein